MRIPTSALCYVMITTAVLLAPVGAGADGDSPCLKQIANTFCLGGNSADIDARASRDIVNEAEPDTTTTEYQLPDRLLRVATRDGRIVRISRLEQPGNWLNYTDWKKRIIRSYGQGEDRSTLPAYATSRSSRRNAINSGRGYAAMVWPQQGWQLELIWDTTDHVELRYSLTDDAPGDASEDL